MSMKRSIATFIILSFIMFLFTFPSRTSSQSVFQLDSERHVSSMIAAGVLDMDISRLKFGMNIISCDGIVWNGKGMNTDVDASDYHDTLYFVWHSQEYVSHDIGIASTRKQQLGIQGWLAYYLGSMYRFIRISPKYYYYLFRMFNAFILAMVLSAITLQLMRAYDIFFATCFYMVCMFSSWIVNFSPNLYWMTFTWFIPTLLGLICINRPEKRFWIYPLIFLSTAIKSFCGYEYITTVMMLPEVFVLSEYFASQGNDKQRAHLMFRMTIGVGFSALAGFIAAILYHSYVRGGGDILSGFNEIYRADILRRTFGSASDFHTVYAESLNASIIKVLIRYFILRPAGWPASILLVLSAASIFTAKKQHIMLPKRDISLLVLSFMCSISWLVLAKSHSYIHTHLNFVLLYMPFIPSALYIFLKYRVISLIPDSEKRNSIITSGSSFIRRIFWLP